MHRKTVVLPVGHVTLQAKPTGNFKTSAHLTCWSYGYREPVTPISNSGITHKKLPHKSLHAAV